MADRIIRERFVITRQLDMGGSKFVDNVTFMNGDVPGRVLDLIRAEITLHMPFLDSDKYGTHLDEVVKSICKRLARSEEFDFDKSTDANKRWKTGMYKEATK